jgi:hypothetical protein
MGINDVNSITTTDLTNNEVAYEILDQNTETNTYHPDWSKWHGHYRQIPEIQSTIDKVAFWACGTGIKAKDPSRQKQIDNIRGNGKDTITEIGRNMMRTSSICGDAIAEIMKDNRGALKNLKPLNPGSVEWETNEKGIITEYRQISINQTTKVKTILATWTPDQIFHLPLNRIADENHGIGTIEKLAKIIVQKHEAQDLMQLLFRRMLFPVRMIEVDTDKEAEMATLKAKFENQIKSGEVMLVPMGTAKMTTEQIVAVVQDSMNWLTYLNKYFILSEGVPEVILGSINSKDTEGASKILAWAWEQVVRNKQNWFEEQFKAQIGFEIDLPDAPTLDPTILAYTRKSGSLNAGRGNNSMEGKDMMNPTGASK